MITQNKGIQMKNILKTKAITPAYLKKADNYFKSKSPIFDTFDEFFLHVGSIVNKTHRSVQEMVELAIEDIVFNNEEELYGHVSLYFEFHNKIVKFLELIEDTKDEDELLSKIAAVSGALCRLSNMPKDELAAAVANGAKELLSIALQDYGVKYNDTNAIKTAFKDKFLKDAIADTMAKIEKCKNEKDAKELLSLTVLLAMFFYRLRKENKAAKKWK